MKNKTYTIWMYFRHIVTKKDLNTKKQNDICYNYSNSNFKNIQNYPMWIEVTIQVTLSVVTRNGMKHVSVVQEILFEWFHGFIRV